VPLVSRDTVRTVAQLSKAPYLVGRLFMVSWFVLAAGQSQPASPR